MVQMFGLLATPLGFAMRLLYNWLQNYGWAIILFTIAVRLLMIPLSLTQQKSSARMSAFQPMIKEIQNKWAKDPNRQNAELQKFYEENNLKMTAGCLPMVVNMLVVFGVIAVIQQPVQYVIGMPKEEIQTAVSILRTTDLNETLPADDANTAMQTHLINFVQQDPALRELLITGAEVTDEEGNTSFVQVSEEWVEKIDTFNFQFMGMNLAEKPSFAFNRYLILPILSVLTMFASSIFATLSTSGTGQNNTTMWIVTLSTGLMFGWFAFTVPVGFSLYYTVSNLVMTAQQFVLRRVFNPEKIREQIEEEMEARRNAKKAKKRVKLVTETGVVEEKEVSDAELAKIRLQRAREMDMEKYGALPAPKKDKITPDRPANGKNDLAKKNDKAPGTEPTKDTENEEENTAINAAENADKSSDTEKKPAETEAYKPGRRKRARLSKENKDAPGMQDEGPSFAEQERSREQQDADKNTQ